MVQLDREKLKQVMYLTSDRPTNDSICHVCGREESLTREHVPPQSAFNSNTRLWERLTKPQGARDTAYTVVIGGGFWVRTLCRNCNNRVCSPYAAAYVEFARHLVDTPTLFDATGRSRLVSIPCDTLMLAKELATMILA